MKKEKQEKVWKNLELPTSVVERLGFLAEKKGWSVKKYMEWVLTRAGKPLTEPKPLDDVFGHNR